MISRKKAVWFTASVLGIALLAMARILSAPPATGSPSAGKEAASGGGTAAKGTESTESAKSAEGSKSAPKPVEVDYLVLRPQPLARKVLSSGTLLAREEVDLRSEAAGRVVGLHFKEGGKVRKGALLVKINDADIRAQFRKAANRLKLSEAMEFRQKSLAERDLISKEEYEIAVSEKNGLLADRDLLQAQLAKTEIHAPFDGVIGLKEVSVGSNIATGTRIAGFFSLDPLKIDFSIPEQYFGQAKAGDSILIRIEGLAKPVKGTVYAIEPKIDPATRMLRLRGYCPNGDGLIPPGASAKVVLPLRVIPDAILVPSNAVLPDIRGQKVMLSKGGKAVSVPVTSPYRSEDEIQIEGVAPGDTLIVSGLIQLKAGSPVKAAEGRPSKDANPPEATGNRPQAGANRTEPGGT